MKQVKIAELKAGLSGYLAEVRNGAQLLVCDRATPIAILGPVGSRDDIDIVPPKAAPIPLKQLRPVKLRKRVDLVALLRESREQR
ncbi:MAG: type II toxin-antitoxin system Phd/YefM family antitoxin [Candidatus Binatia bacterium]